MRILVVGGGIAGLTFARSIASAHDCTVEVVEQANQFQALGAGIILQPNGMAVLERLGLASKVIENGSVITHMRHSRNAEPTSLPLAEIWEGLDHPTVGIRRSVLQTILLDGIGNEISNVRISLGRSITHISETQSGRIIVFDGAGASKPYDLVVAADGVRSRLRTQLSPGSEAIAAGLQWWRLISIRPDGIGPNEWISTDCVEGSFGIYPIGGDFVHSHVMFRGESPCKEGTEIEYLDRKVSRWDPLIAAIIRNRRTKPHFGVPMMVRPPIWGMRRCILIGDSAHAIAPTLSQGGSLAMEDGYALAHLLKVGQDFDSVLSQFSRLRDPSVSWALKMANAQVNGLRRPFQPSKALQASLGVRYMQRMYAPIIAQTATLQQLSSRTTGVSSR